jgi:site-specific recombinase XerD
VNCLLYGLTRYEWAPTALGNQVSDISMSLEDVASRRGQTVSWCCLELSALAGLDPHMLRHSCGYKLANDGVDTRTIQAYLGHRSIQHTVRYTELAATRFKSLFRD